MSAKDIVMEIGDYNIRPLKEDYLRMVLNWRNSDRIHKVMLTDHKITWEEHSAWFERHKDDNPQRYFVFFYKDRPVGYIGFNDFVENESCDPGSYIGETEDLPFNAGLALFFFVADYPLIKLKMKKINTYVLEDNKTSLDGSKLLGFVHDPQKDDVFAGRKGLYYILESEVWQKKRSRFLHMLEG